MTPDHQDRIKGILLGTAVGDSLGLPAEGLKPSTIKHLGWGKNLKHRFFFGRGMWSDDTEHTIMLAQALLASGQDADKFARKFAWELRWWLFGLPAGVGLATARAILKLWLGIPPGRSGIFSAGNGPAMRTAIIAAFYPEDQVVRWNLVKAHTRITHRDPKAVIASLAVTEVATLLLSASTPPAKEEILAILWQVNPESENNWVHIVHVLEESWGNNDSIQKFLEKIGANPKSGISGYIYHTVPAVIYLGGLYQWEFEKVISAVIAAGGDTDTAAAIAGALCGAFGGGQSIPHSWTISIMEKQPGIRELNFLAGAINNKNPIRIRPYCSLFLMARNILFLFVVLVHGFARLLSVSLRRG